MLRQRTFTDSRNGSQLLAQTYGYNARSWVTGISGSLLNMSMRYGLDHDGQESAFNGNMASMEWKTGNEGSRRYSFRYDGLSRLTEARYTETDSGNAGRYSTSYSYDKHGNIESLGRNGLQDGGSYGKVDELYYEYDGNRLCKVSNAVEAPLYKGAMHFADGADEDMEYSYDADGNMTADRNKGISGISYNVLNLPEHISFDSGKYLDIAYSSTGEKLRSLYRLNPPQIHEPGIKSLSSGIPVPGDSIGGQVYPTRPGLKDSLISWVLAYGMHRTDYCGDIIYEDLNPTPSRILFDGGYVTFVNNRPAYHFYLADHQGNVRMIASAGGAVEETNHYYPFGALFGESAGGGRQRYKYNGKELDRLLALDWYDYGARWYDPVLARWHTIDPLCEKYYDISPYVYCNNNAVNGIDPDGMDWYLDKDKTWQFSPYIHSQKDLEDGQLYKGLSFSTGKGKSLIMYRSDGSILFSNETAAYNRMWNQADVHYRNIGYKGGREVGGFILKDGKVLVLPDYKNDRNTSGISVYGYNLKEDGTLTKGNEKFNVMANIHTHQKGAGDPTPSFYPLSSSDLGVSKKMGGRPVLTMGHDNMVYGIFYNKQGKQENFDLKELKALLRKEYTIYPWLKQTKFR